jgi:hypothetical protein
MENTRIYYYSKVIKYIIKFQIFLVKLIFIIEIVQLEKMKFEVKILFRYNYIYFICSF